LPTKIITLSQRDQDLLRVALVRAEEWEPLMRDAAGLTAQEQETTERIKLLKEKLV
jgi:hypothetical protein